MSYADPVCGKVLAPDEAAASAPYEAILHHFCSQECQGRFWTNPGLYVPRSGSVVNDASSVSSLGSRPTPLPWHRTE